LQTRDHFLICGQNPVLCDQKINIIPQILRRGKTGEATFFTAAYASARPVSAPSLGSGRGGGGLDIGEDQDDC